MKSIKQKHFILPILAFLFLNSCIQLRFTNYGKPLDFLKSKNNYSTHNNATQDTLSVFQVKNSEEQTYVEQVTSSTSDLAENKTITPIHSTKYEFVEKKEKTKVRTKSIKINTVLSEKVKIIPHKIITKTTFNRSEKEISKLGKTRDTTDEVDWLKLLYLFLGATIIGLIGLWLFTVLPELTASLIIIAILIVAAILAVKYLGLTWSDFLFFSMF